MKTIKKPFANWDWPFIKTTLKVLIPIVLSSIVIVAVSFVDNIMVNGYQRAGAPDKIDYAAVGMVGELWFAFQSFYVALAVVFAVLYSQFAKNQKLFSDVARFNSWTSIILAIVISLLMFFLNEPLVNLYFLGGESVDDAFIRPIAYDYLQILSLGQIFIALSWAMLNPLTIKGKANYMLYLSIVSIVLNFTLDYLLIYVADQGAQGSAWATVISYFVQFLMSIYFIFLHRSWFQGFWRTWKQNPFVVKEIFKRTYLFLSIVLMQATFGFTTVLIVNFYSTSLIRPMSTAYMVSSVMFTVFQGTNRGVKVFIGPLLGEGKFEEAKAKSKQLWYANILLSVVFITAGLIIASFFPYVMLDDPYEIKIAQNMIFTFAGSFFAYIIMSYFGALIEVGGYQFVPNFWNYFFPLWAALPVIAFFSPLVVDLPFELNFLIAQAINYIAAAVIFYSYRKFKWLRTIKQH